MSAQKATGKKVKNKSLDKLVGKQTAQAVAGIVGQQMAQNRLSPEELDRIEKLATADEVLALLPEGWARNALGLVIDALEQAKFEPGMLSDMCVLENSLQDNSGSVKVHITFCDPITLSASFVARSTQNLVDMARMRKLPEDSPRMVKLTAARDYRAEVQDRAGKLAREKVSTALESIPGVEVITYTEVYADLKLSPVQ